MGWLVVELFKLIAHPGTKNSGVFYYKEKMTDFTKLNDRIVKQAFDASKIVLSEAQKQKLFQNKVDRAQDMLKGRDTVKSLDQFNRVV